MNGNCRSDIKPGIEVLIVLKKDQRSGNLTQGIVKDILTNSSTHPHGIKVRLTTGEIGRVKEISDYLFGDDPMILNMKQLYRLIKLVS